MKKPTILYVDDQVINLTLFKLTFETSYEVMVASSGFEALSLIDIYPNIDLIVSDMMMPEMNGLEFIRTLKFNDDKNDIPCYILSACFISEEIEEAINNNIVADFIPKPVDKEQFEKVISKKYYSMAS